MTVYISGKDHEKYIYCTNKWMVFEQKMHGWWHKNYEFSADYDQLLSGI